jgi:hypothetical protein
MEFLVGKEKLDDPKGFPINYNILNDEYFVKTFEKNNFAKK